MKDNWKLNTLREVFEVKDGTHDSPKYIDQGYPLITSKNLKNGSLTYDRVKFISEEDFNNINKRSKVNKGDLLFAMIGTIGNPVIIDHIPNFAIKNVALFKKKNDLVEYLKYYLLTNSVINKMQSDAKGSTQKFVSLGYLRDFKIPIPPLEEQQKIVEKLDKAFELLDQAKANIEKNIQNAKELFQSKLDEVFSQQGEGWVDCKFKDVLDIINGKNQKDVESINGEFPIYGSAGKVMGYASNYLCPENTIIIGRKGTIDNPLFIDHKFWNVDTAFGLKSKGDILDKLLYYYTKTIDFKSMDKGTTLPSLTKKDLLEVGISFPSDLKKQNELLSVLDRLSQDVSNLNQKYQQKLSNIEELRKSILEKAFKGELTN